MHHKPVALITGANRGLGKEISRQLGAQGYTAVQLMQIGGERGVRIIPEILVGASGGGSMVEALLGVVLKEQLAQRTTETTQANGSGAGAPAQPPLPEIKVS